MAEDSQRSAPGLRASDRPGAATAPANHFVQLYDDEDALADSVATFMAIGLAEGGAAVVIAQRPHREAIERALSRSVNLRVARDRGRYVSLDAEETLSLFMRGGIPDAAEFERALAGVVDRLPAGEQAPRLFGEMVAVLWSEGNAAGALALEDLWNDFLRKRPARLFCAYPSAILQEDSGDVGGVYDCHDHIVLATSEAAS